MTVPNLHPKNVIDAHAELRALGLKVAIDGPITVASNHVSGVSGQVPEAGNEVEPGSTVTLHPGFGPMGSIFVVKEPDPVVLPDLIGMRLDLAIRRLERLGLEWSVRPMPALPQTDARTLLEEYEVMRMAAPAGSSYDQFSRRGNTTTFRPLGLWAKLADD